MSTIRIMSNNQWYCDSNSSAWEEKGFDCSAEARARGFARMFAELDADIIGLQECSPLMASMHMDHFKEADAGYALLWGRDTPILYKTEKFELIDSDYLIYPEKIPNFDGNFNNGKTKSYCIAVLKSKEDGKMLIFASTHLWFMSGNPDSPFYLAGSHEARAYQLGLLMDKIDEFRNKYNCPAMLVGDLNTTVTSMALKSAFERGYLHAREIATDYADNGHGMHRCDEGGFGPYTLYSPDYALDHVLVKGMQDGKIKRFDRYSPEYYMALSDHLPVTVDMEL